MEEQNLSIINGTRSSANPWMEKQNLLIINGTPSSANPRTQKQKLLVVDNTRLSASPWTQPQNPAGYQKHAFISQSSQVHMYDAHLLPGLDTCNHSFHFYYYMYGDYSHVYRLQPPCGGTCRVTTEHICKVQRHLTYVATFCPPLCPQ